MIIIIVIILLALLSFLAGYIMGKKKGLAKGRELGIDYAPLLIRMESLKNGQCMICMSSIDCNSPSSMVEY